MKYFVIVPFILLAFSLLIHWNYFSHEDEGVELGVNVHNLFITYDVNSDGYLSPLEFQTAYYDMQAGAEVYVGKFSQREEQNVSVHHLLPIWLNPT